MTRLYSAIYPYHAHLLELPEIDKMETIFLPEDMVEDDSILLLHGGADISPTLYGHKPIKQTDADETLSHRDRVEKALVETALKRNIPIFGICRGAQFMCAMSGGSLVQHVDGHTNGRHRVTTIDGSRYETTSAHHQMMNPRGSKFELLAWSSFALSKRYLTEEEKNIHMPVEPEVVFFPETKTLAVQGHPEWMKKDSMFVKYCLKLIKEKLLVRPIQTGST